MQPFLMYLRRRKPVLVDNEHKGHRGRMKERYDKTHLAGFAEHEIVEMLLFYAIRQGNTNGIAHDLLKKFGTIKNILHTPAERLMQVKGVGAESARLLTMLGEVYDMLDKEPEPVTLTSDNAHKFFTRLFRKESKEVFYIVCLDPRDRILTCRKLSEGQFDSVSMDVSEVVKTALDFNSSQVVFAHNHPSGIAVASDADIVVTKSMETVLNTFGIKMRDHIIVAGDKCVSVMAQYKRRRDKSLEKDLKRAFDNNKK